MRKRSVVLVLLACALLQGCIHFSSTVPVAVLDGDTEQPVPGATVAVGYDGEAFWYSTTPRDVEVKTGVDGLAKVKVTGAEEGGAVMSVTAPGYIDYSAYPEKNVPRTFEAKEVNGKKAYAVPIYRLPAPQMVIVLPDGYRGPVRITRKYSNRWV